MESDDEPILGNPEERRNLLNSDSGNADEGVTVDDEDFFLHGPRIHIPSARIDAVREQVNQVASTLRETVGHAFERGDRLSELSARSNNLSETSEAFMTQAGRLRRQAWWEQTRFRILLGIIFLVIIIIIITYMAS